MNERTVAREASVLLSFRAANVRSFRDTFEFSMLATRLAAPGVERLVAWRDSGAPVGVLPAACVFGSNASGKTNLLRAMNDMRRLVVSSFLAGSPTARIPRRPFVLDSGSRESPSRYEIDVVVHGTRYEYGFEIDDQRVREEWAYRYPRGRAALLFQRVGERIDLGASEKSRGRAVRELLRPNALFLSTAAATNHPDLLPLFAWFERNLILAEADSRIARQVHTAEMLGSEDKREELLALLRAADLGVTGVVRHEPDPVFRDRVRRAVQVLRGVEGELDEPNDLVGLEQVDVRLLHAGTDEDVDLPAHEESEGTLVWFGLIGPIVDVLSSGSVLLADELDASLHPALVAELINLFQNPQSNPRRAQIIFNSHDVTLLGDSADERLLGRDQIWFSEKSRDGSTRIYPLVDLDPRKGESIGRRYLAGRYGATPILSRSQFEDSAAAITPK